MTILDAPRRNTQRGKVKFSRPYFLAVPFTCGINFIASQLYVNKYESNEKRQYNESMILMDSDFVKEATVIMIVIVL